jgi:antitoxin component YwqK of YwqJK toxin-antitoxin module
MKLILRYFVSFFIIFLSGPVLFAQATDTVWNKMDQQGRRQGFWKANYDDGYPKFKGFFKDGKPVGELQRFYEDGTIKARMIYHENDDSVKVSFYYQTTNLWAKGQYADMKKAGEWSYYSYYSGKLVVKENYERGLKIGMSQKFYESGALTEELEFKNDMKNGKWNQFYENGVPRLKGNYQANLRTGSYLVFYPTGQTQISGQFKNDKMEGKWLYYDEKGKVELEMEYQNGIALNEDKIDEHQKELLIMLELNKGKIPEPNETNMSPTLK